MVAQIFNYKIKDFGGENTKHMRTWQIPVRQQRKSANECAQLESNRPYRGKKIIGYRA